MDQQKPDEFDQILEKMMRKLRMSVRELASVLKVSPKTVDEWGSDNGRSPRNPECLKWIVNYLDVSIYYLLFGKEDPKSDLNEFIKKFHFDSGVYEVIVLKKQSTKHCDQ
jgi:transcriptional regulator with XRE-family HTH domain